MYKIYAYISVHFLEKNAFPGRLEKKLIVNGDVYCVFCHRFLLSKIGFFFRAKTGQFFDHAPFAGASTNLCWEVGSCRLGNLLRPENCIAALHVSPRSKRWAACTVSGAAVRALFPLASFCHRLLRQVRGASPLQLRTVVANSEQLRSRNPIKRGEPGDGRLKLQKTKARRSQKVSVLKARKNALPTAQNQNRHTGNIRPPQAE